MALRYKELEEMEGLEKIFLRLEEENKKKAEAILKEAISSKADILKELEEEAIKHFEYWFQEEKAQLLRKREENIFNFKMESKKSFLEKKEEILEKALKEVEQFLTLHREYLPKKEVVTKDGKKEVTLEIDEFIDFLRKFYAPQLEDFLG